MRIEDRFRVNVPVEEAWRVLLDVERIAPCLPGAQLQEVEGEEYRGVVKVKVGPITAQYRGAARLVEVDEAGRRAVIQASGRDTRGQGNASATVVATLASDGEGTEVAIDTDLSVTGKVAQFGRGVLADVSSKLLAQFAENLERDVLAAAPVGEGEVGESAAAETVPGREATTAPGEAAPAPSAVRRIEGPEAEPVDLLEVGGAPVAKRLLPLLGVLVLVGLVVWWHRSGRCPRVRRR